MSPNQTSLLTVAALALALSTASSWAQHQSAQPGADATPLLEAAATRVAQADEAQTPDRKAKKERRICKDSAPTGTRISKKTCLTVAQWEEAQRRSQDATNSVQTNQLLINKQGN